VTVAALAWLSTALASPAARTDINFLTAPKGPASAFSGIENRPRLLRKAPRIVLTARARRITDLNFNGRDHVLLVAPTQLGTYCTSLSGPYGGTGCSDERPILGPGLVGDQSGPILFDGSFSNANAARIEVTYQDGSSSAIPFFWVSKPIDAGFFVYQVPTANRRPGARPDLLSVYNSAGKLLARQALRTTVA
jgi:hypothetical protein